MHRRLADEEERFTRRLRYATGTYPTPGPMSLQLNVSGQGAAQFAAGRVVTPEFVQAQWSSAGASSNGRLQNSAMIQQPGLVVS